MSVAAVGGSSISADLLRVLQQLGNQTPGVDGASAPPSGTDAAASQDATAGVQGAAPEHHHHGHRAGGLRRSIESAVTSALQGASSDGDVNKVIQDAIAGVLKSHDPKAAADASNGQAGDATQNSAAAAGATDQHQAFLQLLQAHGIDPQQFRSDFQAALSEAQGSNPDFAKIFKSFPAGSSVDEVA